MTTEIDRPISGNYRWRICALLFLATTINYMDRSVLGVLGPTLQYRVFNWSDKDFAAINIAFKMAYAVGLLSMGAIIDRLGTRVGYTLAIAIWSVFGMLHAAVRPAFSLVGFCVARFGLGLGESGNFPAAIKTVGEWFPKKERAFATGIFNAGSNVGAILAPLIIPLVVLPDGTHWQYAFLTTGLFSALWVAFWLTSYSRPEVHPKLSPAELAHINSDSAVGITGGKVSWFRVLPLRETWAFAAGKTTDAVWWFYLFWGGKFLFDRFGLSLSGLALPMITIYVIADGGSIAGGWASSFLIKRGWPINRARKITLLCCALCILPVVFVPQIGTRFNINGAFFDRIGSAKIASVRVISVDGKSQKQTEYEPVPPAISGTLQSLSGNSYASAREFTEAARRLFGAPKIAPLESVLLQSAGPSRIINDAFLAQIGPAVSTNILGALRTLRGKQFISDAQFLDAARESVGKLDVNRVEPILIASARSDQLYWIAVLLIALAAAGHQAWSANLFTLVSDVFPKRATASVTGLGGFFGALAGILADLYLGKVLTSSGPSGYSLAFLLAGSCYLIALGVVHLLMPRMTPLTEDLRHV